MRFEKPLQKGLLLSRYKRFFADVKLDDTGAMVTAHVPNTGSLKGALAPPQACWVSRSDDPKRKLKHTLELIENQGSPVGVNTNWPRQLVQEVVDGKLWKPWARWGTFQTEVSMGPEIDAETRLDGVFTQEVSAKRLTWNIMRPGHAHFIEIKNVTMRSEDSLGGFASFPDGVSSRAQKHVRVLMKLIEAGYSAELVFVIQRADVSRFSPARDIDPVYAGLLKEAQALGVLITCFGCRVSPQGIEIDPHRKIEIAI